jgi:glycosyltransferase involved in cell wall biosynthesis
MKTNGIVFISAYCGKSIFDLITRRSITKPNISSQTFNGGLYVGLKGNGVDVKVLSYLPIAAYPGCAMRHVRRGMDAGDDGIEILPFMNYQFLKQGGIFLSTLYAATREMLRGKHAIICDYMYLPTCLASLLAARMTRKRAFLIVPDIAELIIRYMGVDRRVPSVAVKAYIRILSSIVKGFDGYILFSDCMKEALDLVEKPTITVEGIFQAPEDMNPDMNRGNYVLYTGGLYPEYGIMELVRSIDFIEDGDIEIRICGAGPLEGDLKREAAANPRLRFLGLLPRDEALAQQRSARILVNPRKAVGDYTRYSFPSKTFEYLYSGHPVAMTRLEGVPEEYDKFYFPIEESTPKGIAATINAILTVPDEELRRRGKVAREFLLAYKNPKAQARRILDFIESTLER